MDGERRGREREEGRDGERKKERRVEGKGERRRERWRGWEGEMERGREGEMEREPEPVTQWNVFSLAMQRMVDHMIFLTFCGFFSSVCVRIMRSETCRKALFLSLVSSLILLSPMSISSD